MTAIAEYLAFLSVSIIHMHKNCFPQCKCFNILNKHNSAPSSERKRNKTNKPNHIKLRISIAHQHYSRRRLYCVNETIDSIAANNKRAAMSSPGNRREVPGDAVRGHVTSHMLICIGSRFNVIILHIIYWPKARQEVAFGVRVD